MKPKFLVTLFLALFALVMPALQSVACMTDEQPGVVLVQTLDQAPVCTDYAYTAVPEVAAIIVQKVNAPRLQAAGVGAGLYDDAYETTDEVKGEDVIKPPLELLKSNWAEILFGLLALIKIFVRITPGVKDDQIFAWLDKLINLIIPNFQTKAQKEANG